MKAVHFHMPGSDSAECGRSGPTLLFTEYVQPELTTCKACLRRLLKDAQGTGKEGNLMSKNERDTAVAIVAEAIKTAQAFTNLPEHMANYILNQLLKAGFLNDKVIVSADEVFRAKVGNHE